LKKQKKFKSKQFIIPKKYSIFNYLTSYFMRKITFIFAFLTFIFTQAQTFSSGNVFLSDDGGLNYQVEIETNATNVFLTFTAPADRWFGLGFGVSNMSSGGDVVIFDGNNLTDRSFAGNALPTLDSNQTWTITSNEVNANVRTLVATRPLSSGQGNYVFTNSSQSITLAWAMGTSSSFSLQYHGSNRGATAATMNQNEEPAPPVISMIGDFNSWSDLNMNTTDNVNFTLTAFTFLSSGNVKFRQNGNWDVNWGSNSFPTGVGTQDGQNIPVIAGTYDISFNITTGAYAFVAVSTGFNDIGFLGGFNDFSQSVPMITVDGIQYQYTDFHFTANDVKFRQDNSWDINWGGNDFPAGTAIFNGGNIPLTAGFYNVSFNLNSLAYNFQQVPVSLIGDGAQGWDTDINMTSNDGGVTFTLNEITLVNGGVKFRTNNAWALNWGGTTFPNGTGIIGLSDNIPTVAGTYNVTFNRVTGAYTFTISGQEPVEFDNIGFIGGFNDFTESVAMNTLDGEMYTYDDFHFTANDVKFRQDNSWANNWGGTGFPSGTGVFNSENNIPLVSGFYNVSFNLVSLDYNFGIVPISIIGTAVQGWETDVDMNTTDNGKTFSLNNVTLQDGELKFRVNNAWTLNYGGTTFPAGTANPNSVDETPVMVTAGLYNITFNRETLAYNFEIILSADNFMFKDVKLYPNPTQNVWNINLSSVVANQLYISDLTGKVIYRQQDAQGLISVDASHLSSGMYLITLESNNQKQTYKLIKN
jgi:hypothetical protein